MVQGPCYLQAVANADLIAKCFVQFFSTLLDLNKITLPQAHVIGFSLGAQIAGKAGSSLQTKLQRITALDPALPLFTGSSSYISKSSAEFVDAIHTNSGLFGKVLPVGHADFYVNEIIIQSHCIGLELGELVLCSHSFANTMFAESILETHYFCGNEISGTKTARMGEYIPNGTTGEYYVVTNKQYPYAQNTTC